MRLTFHHPTRPPPRRQAITFVEDMTAAEKALKVEKVPAGLQNLGNTCYMNATLQCLRQMPELQSALAGVNADGHTFTNSDLMRLLMTPPQTPAGQLIMERLPAIMSSCIGHTCRQLDTSGAALPPVAFVELLRNFYAEPFAAKTPQGHWMQQDAEEFFTLITDLLKRALPSTGENSFDALMGLELEETLACIETDLEPVITKRERQTKLVCNISGGTAGAKVDHIYDGLKLALEGTVEKQSAVLGRDAVWSKKARVVRLPKYMCFQFMRFFWNRTPGSADHLGVKSKIMRAVAYPDIIDIYDVCSADVQARLRANRSADDKRIEGEMTAKRAKIAEELKAESAEGAMTVDGEAKGEPKAAAVAGGGSSGGDDGMDIALEGLDEDEAAALKAAMAFSVSGDMPPNVFSPSSAPSSSSSTSSGFGQGVPADFLGHYELHGVVTHKGRSCDSGHYIGWVRKEPGGDLWYKYDDQTVSPCTTADILRLSGGGDHDIAYFAFYKIRTTKRNG